MGNGSTEKVLVGLTPVSRAVPRPVRDHLVQLIEGPGHCTAKVSVVDFGRLWDLLE